MALIAREGAEVKVLLKNVFPNLIEAPSVGKDRGEVAPQESYEKKKSKNIYLPTFPCSCPAWLVPSSKSKRSQWPWGRETFAVSPAWGTPPPPRERPLCERRKHHL